MTDQIRQESGDISDSEALYLTREESRAVLDRKLKALDELNGKAMHTVRTAVVLLGLVTSTLALLGSTGRSQFGTVPLFAIGTGILCLLLSIVAGIVTYSTSGVPDGISRSYRDEVRDGGFDEVGWLLGLLGGYDQWVEGVNRGKLKKERHLLWAQLFLTAGLILVSSAVGLYVTTN